MGAVAPTPKISARAYTTVKGQAAADLKSDSALAEQVGQAVAADADPIDDLRGTAEFRREIAAVLAQRALARALERAMGNDEVIR
jgi:carbon-monoxide dehydrogenase medium subunit